MIPLYTAIVLFAFCMHAFFALTEMVFTSANRSAVKELALSGDKRARLTDELLNSNEVFLGTTLVGTNIAVVLYSILATRIFIEYFGSAKASSMTVLFIVPGTLLFAEIIPKMIGKQFATSLSCRLASVVWSFYRVFHPVIITVNFLVGILLVPVQKLKKNQWRRSFTKSDLKRILLLGHETGEVEADEVELIHKVLDFEAKKVSQTMVPLFKVSSIEEEETVETLKRLVALTNFSRIPVYRDKKENLTGVVNIYDILFSHEDVSDSRKVKEFAREPVYVAPTDGLDIALARLRHKKRPMGIVVGQDEKRIGIITIEDILEQIVGEF